MVADRRLLPLTNCISDAS